MFDSVLHHLYHTTRWTRLSARFIAKVEHRQTRTYLVCDVVLQLDVLVILLVLTAIEHGCTRKATQPEPAFFQASGHAFDEGRGILGVEPVQGI